MRLSLKGLVPARLRRWLGGAPGDPLFHLLTEVVALGILALLAAIVIVLFVGAGEAMRAFGPRFLTGSVWDPTPPEEFGAVPFVYGTLVTSAVALLLGVPVSLGIAIFLSEQAPPWIRTPLTFLVEVLAAVPSVVYGLWGIFVLAPGMRDTVEPALQSVFGFLPLFHGTPFGLDKLTAGVILAIMVIPTISAVSREALLAVPDSQREAALSLGATRWETTRLAVLRYARSGIFGATILGLGRAVGETMAVLMATGHSVRIPHSLFDPVRTLTATIAAELGETVEGGAHYRVLFVIGSLLMLIAFAVNLTADLIVKGIRGKQDA